MTRASFRKLLRDEHAFLVRMNQPARWEDVICVVPEWCRKYEQTFFGVFDA
jgi:hypothetical protein